MILEESEVEVRVSKDHVELSTGERGEWIVAMAAENLEDWR